MLHNCVTELLLVLEREAVPLFKVTTSMDKLLSPKTKNFALVKGRDRVYFHNVLSQMVGVYESLYGVQKFLLIAKLK